MSHRLQSVAELLFGERLAWSAGVLLAGIGLGQSVPLFFSLLDRNAGVLSAAPTGFPGVLFALVLPPLVGVALWRNRGVVPTFAVTFLPILAFYRVLPRFLGAIVDPAPIYQAQVYRMAALYWSLGAVVALGLHYGVDG